MIILEWQKRNFWSAMDFPVMNRLASVIDREFGSNQSKPCSSISKPGNILIQLHIPLIHTQESQKNCITHKFNVKTSNTNFKHDR